MLAPGRGPFGAACAAFAAVLVGVLVFGVSRAGADPPTFDPVSDQTLEASSPAGAVANFNVTATDDNGASVVCDHNGGDTFPVGSTPVSCTATDTLTGEVQGPQVVLTITVVDTTAPNIATPGNLTTEATSQSGAAVNYSAGASDLVDGSITPSCNPAPGATFGLGTTTVNCTASDSHGNNSSANFNITVQDTT